MKLEVGKGKDTSYKWMYVVRCVGVYWGAETDLRPQFYAFITADCWVLFIECKANESEQDRNLVSSPQSRLWCTHRLCAGEGDVPDLLRDELQLGVVPLPLPLLPLQARDHLRPGHRHRHFVTITVSSYSYSYLLDFKSWIF